MPSYLKASISNGNPREQALIRRWWHEEHGARGSMVWEYHLEGLYADAIWFPEAQETAAEVPGTESARRSPLADQEVVLCEAKASLTPELVGQALVYTQFATRAGAVVRETVVFAECGTLPMQEAARQLGLTVVVRPL